MTLRLGLPRGTSTFGPTRAGPRIEFFAADKLRKGNYILYSLDSAKGVNYNASMLNTTKETKMKREYKGFRLENGTIDNSKCPHLHTVQDGDSINCQTCGKVIVAPERGSK